MQPAIHIENLSKAYRVGELGASLSRKNKDSQSQHLAIDDVSFQVNKGEILGIIGSNGAGKSTLLKLISRITEADSGTIKIKGKVASMLEVGTGMHPDLTGRENVFLNGAILGMSKAEISSKFDDIAAFSGCENYIDTPIKRYSSGMKVRLGFSVAAFLETDILIIDEVLAVGDAAFQAKAVDKVLSIAAQGEKTILFVSHSMAAVKSICGRAILLEAGSILFDGDVDQAISKYLGYDLESHPTIRQYDIEKAPGNNDFKLLKAAITPEGGDHRWLTTQDSLRLELEVLRLSAKGRVDLTVQIHSAEGVFLAALSTVHLPEDAMPEQNTEGLLRFTTFIPANILNARTYHFSILIIQNKRSVSCKFENLLTVSFIDAARDTDAWMGKVESLLVPKIDWKVESQKPE